MAMITKTDKKAAYRYNYNSDEYENVTVLEKNGNLAYVENDNGDCDWVARQELSYKEDW